MAHKKKAHKKHKEKEMHHSGKVGMAMAMKAHEASKDHHAGKHKK